MSISRGVYLLKNVVNAVATKKTIRQVVPSRGMSAHTTFHYRHFVDSSKGDIIMAECLGGFLWWWILWHLWHDFGHVVGEFDYPDPSKWTDEELGILPED